MLVFVFKKNLYLKEWINYITLIPGYRGRKERTVSAEWSGISVHFCNWNFSVYSQMQSYIIEENVWWNRYFSKWAKNKVKNIVMDKWLASVFYYWFKSSHIRPPQNLWWQTLPCSHAAVWQSSSDSQKVRFFTKEMTQLSWESLLFYWGNYA